LKVGEALVRAGLITKEQLRQGLERQVIFGRRVGTNLVELKSVKEADLVSFLRKQGNGGKVQSSAVPERPGCKKILDL
jgi:hypothetical protein